MQIELGKTYLTRDGQKVKNICTDMNNEYSVVGILTERDGREYVSSFTEDGSHDIDNECSDYDLVEEYSQKRSEN